MYLETASPVARSVDVVVVGARAAGADTPLEIARYAL
jgi:hypothetical protein